MKYFTKETLIEGLNNLKNKGITSTRLYMYRKFESHYLYMGMIVSDIDDLVFEGDDDTFKIIVCNDLLTFIINCNMVELEDD